MAKVLVEQRMAVLSEDCCDAAARDLLLLICCVRVFWWVGWHKIVRMLT